MAEPNLSGLMQGGPVFGEPDPAATQWQGRRPFLIWDNEGDDLISHIRQQGTVNVYWRYGDKATRGWWYAAPNDSPFGPFDTSKEAYESAIGW